MRTESDIHGPHGSHAPACLSCGLPLHPDVEVCPFCEERVERPEAGRALMVLGAERSDASLRERILVIGTCLVIAVAAVGVAISLFV